VFIIVGPQCTAGLHALLHILLLRINPVIIRSATANLNFHGSNYRWNTMQDLRFWWWWRFKFQSS